MTGATRSMSSRQWRGGSGSSEAAAVIFTSDHGDNLFDHGIFYKGELYDTVVNVPLIIRAPGVERALWAAPAGTAHGCSVASSMSTL